MTFKVVEKFFDDILNIATEAWLEGEVINELTLNEALEQEEDAMADRIAGQLLKQAPPRHIDPDDYEEIAVAEAETQARKHFVSLTNNEKDLEAFARRELSLMHRRSKTFDLGTWEADNQRKLYESTLEDLAG